MCNACKFLNIKNNKGRVGNSLCKKNLRIRLKCSCDLFLAGICINECAVNSQLLKGNSKKIERSTVNCGSCNNMVACFTDVKYCIEVSCLPGRSQDRSNTAFKISNLRSDCIIGWILETGVEISVSFQVK